MQLHKPDFGREGDRERRRKEGRKDISFAPIKTK